jgi:hypothetical protein
MKIETREVYKCEYCNKMYQRKFLCERHEVACKERPDYMRPCHTCKNVQKKRETILAGYGDMHGREVERTVDVLFCSKLDCFIHPPSVAAKGNAFDMGDKDNIEMPRICDFHAEQDYI